MRRITAKRGRKSNLVELLENRVLLAAGSLEISEFLAKNTAGLKDQFGTQPDWIEVHNRSSNPVDLGGYFLTDDPGELDLWRFPSVTLQPDQYYVVFASGNDLKDPSQPLHTNFKLKDEGDYLALVAPDGQTVVDEYSPKYPSQSADMSYGRAVETQETTLISASATPRTHVPTAADAGLGWTLPTFDDSSWPTGNLAVGFDADPPPTPGPAGFAIHAVDTSSGNITDAGVAAKLLDGNPSGFTIASDLRSTANAVDFMDGGHYAVNNPLPNGATAATTNTDARREQYTIRATAYVTIPQGTYTVGVFSDDGFAMSIPGVTFTSRVNEDYTGIAGGPDRLAFSKPRGPADSLGTFTVGPGGLTTTITLDYYEQGGGDQLEFYVASGTKTAWDASSFALVGNGAFGWGVYQSAPPAHYGSVIGTDLQSQMLNVNAGAYLRLPFVLESGDDYDSLKLRVKYDDGFVAYVNGQRLFSRNAPDTPVWNSTATGSHADEQALLYEEITVPGVGQYLREGVNVLSIHALNASASDSDFLISPELVGVRTLSEDVRYFPTPTPGAPNSTAVLGKVADTKFSKDRGFYDQAFPVTITTATAGAQIRYTLDGSAPTAATGLVYSGPITIPTTTVLRAAAFKAGYLSSDVDTQTYLFLGDVIHQPATPPPGYPSTWNGVAADYEMDPNVVNAPAYSGKIIDALKAVPTLSLVLKPDDMFGAQGLYVNAQQAGVAWERPASAELINPDGSTGFQINAGLRIQGGVGRVTSAAEKHSFRLVFSDRTGPTKLDYPIFGDSAAQEFDTLTLRAGFNNSWVRDSASERNRTTYLEDEYIRQTQLAMGDASAHGTFYQLYINGIYWGLYNAVERPAAPFAAEYYGGQKEDWDALNSSEAIDGDKTAWNTLQSLVNGPGGAGAPTANWLADSNNYAAVKQYLDVDDFIDYMLLNIWGGNGDWDDHNWYAARRRAPGEGYKFFSWDAERTLEDDQGIADRTEVNQADKPSRIYKQLRANLDFRMQFADKVQKFFFNGGALTVAANQARYQALVDQIDEAIIGESARWGDNRREPPYTRDVEWSRENQRKLNTYFPNRNTTVLNQLKADGLFPSVNAPTFNQWGGAMAAGFSLTMSVSGNPAGTIYYTLDGTDPRVSGGGIAAGALIYNGPIGLANGARVKARFLSGTNWSALDDTTFYPATPPKLRVSEVMYNPPQAAVGSVYAKDDFEYVEVTNSSSTPLDLSGMRFTRGINFTFPAGSTLGAGQRTVIVRNLTAFQSRYGAGVAVAGVYTDELGNAGDTLQLETSLGQVVESFTYDDDWYKQTDGGGYSLVAVDPSASDAVMSTKEGWRPSTLASGAPGVADPGVNNNAVVINEVRANSPAGDADGDWVELHNTTGAPVDVGGWFLSDSASDLTKYQIAAGTVIPADGYLVLKQNANFGNAADSGTKTAFSLADGGGGVFLSGNDGSGGVSGYRDSVDFGASDAGVTFGRYVKSTGRSDFVEMAAATPGAGNSAPRVGPVVINEINYNPVGFGVEFVELYNLTNAAVPLFDPAHPANVWRFTDGIVFDFPQGAALPANGYGIVASVDPVTFRNLYNVPDDVPVWGPFLGNLDNAGETVELSRPAAPDAQQNVPYVRVDKVSYEGGTPWPALANGTGPSLGRKVADGYGNDVANWQTYGSGGTPGLLNTAVQPLVSAGPNATATTSQPLLRSGSFSDASPGETWTASVNWGDAPGAQPLALNADKTFTLNHAYARAGTYTVVVRVTDSVGAFGTATFQVVVSDDTPPQVLASGFGWEASPHRLTFRFSESVDASLGADDLMVKNLTTGATLDPQSYTLAYDPQTNTATFTFASLLADGQYRATLSGAGISDGAGNAMGSDVSFDFFLLAGDVNRDGTVDFNDLVVLAQNYNTTGGKTFVQGDFNYDGNVDFNDLVILAQRYNGGVPAAGAPPVSAASLASAMGLNGVEKKTPAVKAIFSTTPVSKPAPPKKAKAPVARVVRR